MSRSRPREMKAQPKFRGDDSRVRKPGHHNLKSRSSRDASRRKSGASKTTASKTSIKSRLRDINRVLSRSTKVPADIRVGYEREIESLQHDMVTQLLEKERHDMIGRYHMVRFFERKRATKILRRVEKAVKACDHDEELPALEKELHVAQIDLNYTQYYPHMVVYQSLWLKNSGDDKETQHVPNNLAADGAKGNVDMWRKVEEATENGTLEILREMVPDEKREKMQREASKMVQIPKAGGAPQENDAGLHGEEQADDHTGAGFFE